SIDDSHAERKITIGLYQYFSLYTYLCDNNFCNDDETSAKLNRSPSKWKAFVETTTQEARYTPFRFFSIICVAWVVYRVD
ncbi:hypothetical protein PENTCL1PPCAC_21651, partial [Pristionchus entomophagus]